MRKISGYLSRLAQGTWPGAIVEIFEDGAWVLSRPGTDQVGLGNRESEAHEALKSLLRQYRETGGFKIKNPEIFSLENNGPANIIMLCDRILEKNPQPEPEILDFIHDIRHQAALDCEYHKQIRAVICPAWHEVKQNYEQKEADKLRAEFS